MKSLSLKLSVAVLIAFLFTAVFLPAAYAASDQVIGGKNSQDQIDIAAKKVTMKPSPGGREAIFEGKVTVKQGDITLLCDRLIVLHEEKRGSTAPGSQNKRLPKDWQTDSMVKTLTALGNVKITQKDLMATAGKALYDHAKRTFTLTEGPPRFWQGRDSGIAKTITMFLDENRFEFLEPTFVIIPSEAQKEKEK